MGKLHTGVFVWNDNPLNDRFDNTNFQNFNNKYLYEILKFDVT